jgi:hypothetical protein
MAPKPTKASRPPNSLEVFFAITGIVLCFVVSLLGAYKLEVALAQEKYNDCVAMVRRANLTVNQVHPVLFGEVCGALTKTERASVHTLEDFKQVAQAVALREKDITIIWL